MAGYGVTDKGFVLKRLDTILAECQSDISEELGFDIAQNPQSMLNASLVVPFCDQIAELWEAAQDSYYAKYPATAEGVNLDNACQFGNVLRKGNLPTEYIIHCTGMEGTSGTESVIPRGHLISSTTNPVVRLKCVNSTTLSRSSCNEIAIKPVGEISGTYTIELNAEMFSYAAESGDDAEDVINGLNSAFSATGYEGTVEETDGGIKYLLIKDTVLSRSNEVVLTSNLTTQYVTGLVHYYTEAYGDVRLPNNTITVITSNLDFLKSVCNKLDPTPGRLQQTDASLRQDYLAKSYANSSRQTNSMESYILDEVLNVNAVRCYENETDITDSMGRPPHSYEIIVDGGEPEEIAKAILSIKAGGIYTYGNILVNVLGDYGDEIPIRFSRPETIYAWIKVALTRGSASINPDYEDIVKEVISEACDGLTIGDPLMSQSFINLIYEALPGITYCSITVAGTTSSSTTPAASAYTAGNIMATQRQKVVVVPGRIGVTLA